MITSRTNNGLGGAGLLWHFFFRVSSAFLEKVKWSERLSLVRRYKKKRERCP